MRLRIRLQDELRARLAASLPAALETVWDHEAVVIAIEKLEFKPAGGIRDDWQHLAGFTGIVRAELRADGVDAIAVEPLLAGLIGAPLFVPPAPDTPEGGITETARAELLELRDTIYDTQVVTALRFSVSGLIERRASDPARPALMLGEAPRIGPGFEADYSQIGGAA